MAAKPDTDSPISVWLVEDNHTFRNTVARILQQVAGLECPRQFSNSEDALQALLEGAVPDVILLDVELPGMGGIEAVQRIKSISPSARIIMLTVFDSHDKIFHAAERISPRELLVFPTRRAYFHHIASEQVANLIHDRPPDLCRKSLQSG